MNSPVKPGAIERLTERKFLNLFTVETSASGNSRPWIFASRKERPLTGPIMPDAAAVIAIVNDGREPRLLVIREFRAPLGRFELALPSGLVDKGETPEAAAARELFEETGLRLDKIAHVSPATASSAGLTDETVCLVYGEASGTLSTEHLEKHEQIESRLLTFAEVRSLLERPSADVISVRLYAALIGFLTAGALVLPPILPDNPNKSSLP